MSNVHQPKIDQLGIDLAKNVFHVCGMTRSGKVVLEKKFTRTQLKRFIERLPSCLIGLEACATAHYWGRLLVEQGHDARLIAPQLVKPFVKSMKNDAHDAEAIAEAVGRQNMRFVSLRSAEMMAVQHLHRVRKLAMKQRLQVALQSRSALAEFGIVLPLGLSAFRSRVPGILEDPANGLPPSTRRLLQDGHEKVLRLDADVEKWTEEIKRHVREDERCRLLMTVPGIGVLTASILVSKFGDGSDFKNGRAMAAAVGLVPSQHSTGGKTRLGSINKRGDTYVRSLCVQGAHALMRVVDRKTDPRSLWVKRHLQRLPKNSVAVALANRNIRTAWAVLQRRGAYQEEAPSMA